ncbi:MAG: hypothetical protein J6I64_06570, partial [Lachnospiraceae bacterium]|nr:hypothetical protein [Lachnospiraceae bacterium]
MRSTDHLPTFRKKKQRKKLLRGLIYFSPIMAMFCLVTAVYIASYYERSNDTEETPGTVVQAGQRENESEQNQGNGILEANPLQNGAENMGGAGTMIPEKSAERQESVDQNKHDTTSLETSSEAMAADDSTDIYITPRMTYTLEIYDARTGQLTTENPPIPNAMYGLNRMELEQYLTQLASVENERQGEIQHHYQVTSFSRRDFTVRQTITEHQE